MDRDRSRFTEIGPSPESVPRSVRSLLHAYTLSSKIVPWIGKTVRHALTLDTVPNPNPNTNPILNPTANPNPIPNPNLNGCYVLVPVTMLVFCGGLGVI